MGDVILNVVLAVFAGLIGGIVTYYFPPTIISAIDRVLYAISVPILWMTRPFLRFLDIVDRE
jgi:hypothetical protein